MGLRGIFDPENGFFRTLSRMVDVVGLSLLWVALSLPLVTFGPACAALYHTVTHCVACQGDSTYLTFFRSFRANLRVFQKIYRNYTIKGMTDFCFLHQTGIV